MPECSPQRIEPQIAMLLDEIGDPPPVSLPDGYAIRTLGPGDDLEWERIYREAFRAEHEEGRFERVMRRDDAFRPDRIFFVCRDGRPVATASAWHRPKFGEQMGYLHYVAVVPSETGRGLGYQVSLACLHRMKSEGRRSAMLLTDDFRVPAIKTYLKMGFRPLLMHENHRQRWRDILAGMGREDLLERFLPYIDGPVYQPPEQ